MARPGAWVLLHPPGVELDIGLESNEGWGFRLIIDDRVEDACTEAEVIEIRRRPSPAERMLIAPTQ